MSTNGDISMMLTPAEQEQLAKEAEFMGAERRTGLGGTDVAAILGQNRWKTAVDVFLEKTGRSEPVTLNKKMLWGIRMEGILARIYAAKHGVQVRRPARTEDNPTGVKRHPDLPILIAHLDRLILNENRGLECKTAGQFRANEWGDEMTDDVPVEYLFQCHTYSTVYGFADGMDLEVLIGGNDDRTYRLPANERLSRLILDEADRFWHQYVKKDKMPPLEPSRRSVEIMNAMYPIDLGATKKADDKIASIARAYDALYSSLKADEKKLDGLKADLMDFMGDATVLIGDGWKATWKKVDSNRLDAKALKEAHPKIVEKFTITQTTRRFTGPKMKK